MYPTPGVQHQISVDQSASSTGQVKEAVTHAVHHDTWSEESLPTTSETPEAGAVDGTEDEDEPEPAFESYDEKLEKVLQTVDLAIDIHSIRNFPYGWIIAGRQASTLQRGPEGVIRGRVLAIIGEFKVGKTWLQRMLLNTETVDSAELHTPGICMRYVTTHPRQVRSHAVGWRPGGLSRRGGGRGRGRGRGSGGAVIPPASQEPEYEYIILDSAGTESACSEYSLSDVRATELIIRKMLITAASRLVYVTSRFNRPTQIAVKAVIDQLRESRKAISSTNRLLVVHNMPEVTTWTVLQQRIQEVKAVYDPTVMEELPWQEDETPVWAAVTKEYPIEGDKKFTYTHYNARLTTHVFIVHHCATSPEDQWRVDFNLAALEVIRNSLFYKDDAVKINLLDTVIEVAKQELPKFVKGFERYDVDVATYNGRRFIVPMVRPESESDSGVDGRKAVPSSGDHRDQLEAEVEQEEEIQPFELNQVVFTDNDVISENEQRLEGNVFFGRDEYIIAIPLPGMAEKNEILRGLTTRRFNFLRLDVTRPHPLTALGISTEGFKSENEVKRWGRSVFTWHAPLNQNFYNLDTWDKKDNATELQNGIFVVRLQREREEGHEDDHHEEDAEQQLGQSEHLEDDLFKQLSLVL